MLVSDLCVRVRPELASLGELGTELVAVVDAVAAMAGGRPLDALDDPGFALDVIDVAPNGAILGRVLDHLRRRRREEGVATDGAIAVTVASAVAEYEVGPFRLLALTSQQSYRTWTRRLVAGLGDRHPASITAGELTDLISEHVLAAQDGYRAKAGGKGGAEMAVAAYRHLWAYFAQKRYVFANVAQELRKPARPESQRRAIRPEEARLFRAAARLGHDPSLDLVILGVPERAALRRVELCRLRMCDIDLDRDVIKVVRGKGDKPRTIPIAPRLHDLLVQYLDERRPADVTPAEWRQSTAPLVRSRPTPDHPGGVAHTRRRIDTLFERLRTAAPQVFADDDVSLHSYRHAIAGWMERNYGRGHVRAVLGHTPRSPTDHYTKVPLEELREPVARYEEWLFSS